MTVPLQTSLKTPNNPGKTAALAWLELCLKVILSLAVNSV